MKRRPFTIGLAALAALTLAYCAIFLYVRPNATQMRVVILPDGTVARYVSEDDDTYTVEIQDTSTIEKDGASVELWSAAEGKGVVYMKAPGKVQVLCEPDPRAEVKCDLTYEEGMCPSTYSCRGLKNGWYEITLFDGESGFIQAKYMNWDAIDTF